MGNFEDKTLVFGDGRMKRRILAISLILLSVASFARADDYKQGQLLVRFADVGGQPPDTAEKNTILCSILPGSSVQREYNIVPGLALVKLPAGTTVECSLPTFNQSPDILYAERNYELELAIIPNDTRFNDLWGMNNTGQTGGTLDADIDAPEAWDIHTGSGSIIVAVTDTGVDYNHLDLSANMWVNTGEIPSNGIDDDGNGYIDDIYGYDFGDDDGDPMDDSLAAGHGTHVSGTIGAVGNNNEGVAGVCWTASVMALKIADVNGILWTDDAISAIEYATDNGANVINASWGGYWYSQGLYDAIEAAGNAGVLFVAAAGNAGTDNDVDPMYPASYDLDCIISVLATDHDDNRVVSWWASNYGATTVDLGAPGSDILSCLLGGGYTSMSGTSMASPHVAGACALVWSFAPALSYTEVRDTILNSAEALVSLDGLCVTGGRLNIDAALLTVNTQIFNNNTGLIYRRIQEAIDDPNTLDGHELIAQSDSWYFENIDFKGKKVLLRSGDVNNPGDPNIWPENTYISGRAGSSSVVTFENGEDATAVLKGFTITEGYASEAPPSYGGLGGGVYCNGTSPTITDCIITANRAHWLGGGICCFQADASITNCTISNNTADYYAGGIFCYDCTPLIKNCLIIDNIAESDDGGGIACSDASPTITNCTIAGNRASDYDGVGGGVYCEDGSDPVVINSIFSGNRDSAIYEYDGASDPNVTYCLFYNNPDGDYYDCDTDTVYDVNSADPNNVLADSNNLDGDPLFVPGRLGNYYLSNYHAGQILDADGKVVDPLVNPEDANSPAIDAGSGDANDPGIGMKLYSTRTDNFDYDLGPGIVRDAGKVDIGYHYNDNVAAVNYDLTTFVVGDGSITPTGVNSYVQYTQVPLTANSDPDNQLKSWDGTDDDSLIEIDPNNGKPSRVQHNVVTMDWDKTVTVEFQTIMVRLFTRVIDDAGTISPETGMFGKEYDRGTRVDLLATPADPSHRIIWNGTDDDSLITRENTVTMTEHKEVTVEFYEPQTHYVPGDYTNIQTAINDAKDGDIIVVASGTYSRDMPRFVINGKAITLTSSNPDDPCAVAATVLLKGIAIYNVGRDTIINGFTLDGVTYRNPDGADGVGPTRDGGNGSPTAGAGLRLHSYYWYPGLPAKGSSPDVRNCVFRNCRVIGGNGGDGINPSGDGGWGAWAHGGAVSVGADSNPRFTNCSFIDCFARGGDGGNGATEPPGRGGLWDQLDVGSWGWDFGPYEEFFKYSGYGGAVFCDVNSSPEFIDCTFVDNYAYGGSSGQGITPENHYRINRFGGAVYAADGSSPTFSNCSFTNNEADVSGPAFWHAEMNEPAPTASDDVYISYGGAVAFEDGATPTFNNCAFNGNLATIGGGMHWTWAEPIFDGCNFVGNSAFHGGGVLFVGGTAKIVRSSFSNNEAFDPNGQVELGEGGAIASLGANAMIIDCDVSNNEASGYGGGIYISNKDVYNVEVSDGENNVLVKNCLVTNNGAGIKGGGISVDWHSDPNIVNCTIADNRVIDGYGGGLSCSYTSYTTVRNSIIWDNSADNGDQIAIGTGYYPSIVSISYSDVKGGAAEVYIEPSCTLCDLLWDANNTNMPKPGSDPADSNPLFVNGYLSDYYLSQIDVNDPCQAIDSPCVDTGTGQADSLPCGPKRYTTRTDNDNDVSDIDMGYHYLKSGSFTDGDLDYNARIDFNDVKVLRSHWLEECSFPCWCHGADINRDGRVDWVDFNILASLYGADDVEPPVPDRSTWSRTPIWITQDSVTMAATPAVDNSGSEVVYYFQCYSGNCHDRGWDPNNSYTDTALAPYDANDPNTVYWYRVRAADRSYDPNDPNDPQVGNKTEWSFIAYARSPGEEAADPPVLTVITAYTTPNSITVEATTLDSSGIEYDDYEFQRADSENFDVNTVSSGWRDRATYGSTWTDEGLDPNTEYWYRVRAYDENNKLTDWSLPVSETTFAEGEEEGVADPPILTVITAYTTPDSITVEATTSDSSGIKYDDYEFQRADSENFDENVVSSGWRDSATYGSTWTDEGLDSNTEYWYRVRAYDENNKLTDWSAPVSETTLAEDTTPPEPNPSLWAAEASGWEGTGEPDEYWLTDPIDGLVWYWHRMEAAEASDATTGGNDPVEYYFDCCAGNGSDSGWQYSPIYDYKVGAYSTICTYRIRTRDAVGNVGSWSDDGCTDPF